MRYSCKGSAYVRKGSVTERSSIKRRIF